MLPFACLWLPDPVEEAVFTRDYAARHFVWRDLLFRTIRACIIPVFVSVRLWQHGLGAHGLNALVNITLNIVVDWMGFDWQRDKKGGKRTAMAIATRIVILVTQAMDATTREVVVTTPGSMVRFMMMQSGLLALFFSNAGVPLLMKHHLLVHGLAVVAMGAFTVPNMCAVAVRAPESGPIVQAVWRFINVMFTGGAFKEEYEPVPEAACWSVVTMSHLVIGLLAPSYAMWVAEYEGRLNFGAGLEELTGDIMRKQMLLFVPVMGLTWLVLNIKLWL